MWDVIKVYLSKFWKMFGPLIIKLWKEIDDDVYAIVQGVVKELSMENLTNEEKRKEALARIKKVLKEEGKDIGDAIINLLIEMAVNAMKLEA